MARFEFSSLPGSGNVFAAQRALKKCNVALGKLGGRVLPEPHYSRELEPSHNIKEPGFTCGCGGTTRIAVPYATGAGSKNEAIVCAICDAATLWPRLQ